MNPRRLTLLLSDDIVPEIATIEFDYAGKEDIISITRGGALMPEPYVLRIIALLAEVTAKIQSAQPFVLQPPTGRTS